MKNIIKAESILYVEDDPSVQEPMSEILNYYCDTLYVASDGKEGLEFFKKYSPQIIVTDILLPYIDGMEMSKQIKQINEEVPIILLSAHNEIEYYKQALELKIESYLIKPIVLKVLEHKLLSCIENINLKKELEEKNAQILKQEKNAAMNKMYTMVLNQWKHPVTTINQIAAKTKKDILGNKIQKSDIINNIDYIIDQTLLISSTMDDVKTFFEDNDTKHNVNIDFSLKTTFKYIQAGLEQNNIELHINKNIAPHDYILATPNDLCIVLMNIVNFAKDSLLNEIHKTRKIDFNIYTKDNYALFEISYNAILLEEEFIKNVFDDCLINDDIDPVMFNLCTTRMIVEERLEGKIVIENIEKIKHPSFTVKIPLVI